LNLGSGPARLSRCTGSRNRGTTVGQDSLGRVFLLERALASEKVIDDDGNEEVRPAHAGEDESSERPEGPERHPELTLGRLRILDGEIQTDAGDNEGDDGENAEYA